MRLTFDNLESQKQVKCGYGVKTGRIGATAIINPPHPPKKKRTENKAKKKERREDSNPIIWSPTAAVNGTLLKHPLIHSPTQNMNEKKSEKKTQQGREGSNLLIWRPTAVNSTLLIVLL